MPWFLKPVTLLAALLALTACNTAPLQEPGLSADHAQALLQRMDECVSLQANTSEQLASQSEQLERQDRQLQTLSQRSSQPVPVPIATEADAQPVCDGDHDAGQKLHVGELEQVLLPSLGLTLTARMDTGAETASIDARNIELFERNGKRWVRFELLDPESGQPVSVERRLKRNVLILQSNSTEAERRHVIKMDVTIGHINQTAEFTLSNRSHLDYQMLIGRNILQDVMVVDVSQKNIAPLVQEAEPETESEVETRQQAQAAP